MSTGHNICRKEFSSLDMNCFLNGVEATVKRKQPVWVAQLDAHPTGDQEVAGSTPSGSATFFHGDCS